MHDYFRSCVLCRDRESPRPYRVLLDKIVERLETFRKKLFSPPCIYTCFDRKIGASGFIDDIVYNYLSLGGLTRRSAANVEKGETEIEGGGHGERERKVGEWFPLGC